LAKEYYHAKNGRSQDHFLAHACYQQAIQLDPNYSSSLFSLGWLYAYGEGVDQDIERVIFYIRKAAKCNHKMAKFFLLLLENSERITAESWKELGEGYYHAKNGQSQDHFLAHTCYQLSVQLNPNYSPSLYRLGWLYEHGEGVDDDLDRAKLYYKDASKLGHYKSSIQLLNLLHFSNVSDDTVSNWYKIGERYLNGEDGSERDCFLAFACFRKITDENSRSSIFWYVVYQLDSLISLGILYQNGYGVDKNLEKAKACFTKAIRYNPEKAKTQLLLLENPDRKTAKSWHDLGESYFHARDGLSRDFFLARLCYQLAIQIDSEHADSLYDLAWMTEYGQGGITENFAQAKGMYREAAELGNIHAKNRLTKLSELSQLGRFWGFIMGVGKIAGGMVINTCSFFLASAVGSGLIGSGTGDIALSITGEDEDISLAGYATRGLTNTAGGFVGGVSKIVLGGVSKVVLDGGGSNFIEQSLFGVGSGALGVIASRAVRDSLQRNIPLSGLTWKEVLLSAVSGGTGGGVNAATATMNREVIEVVFNESNEFVRSFATVIAGGVMGAASGVASATASTITVNYCNARFFADEKEKPSWHEGIGEAILTGSISEGVVGAIQAAATYKKMLDQENHRKAIVSKVKKLTTALRMAIEVLQTLKDLNSKELLIAQQKNNAVNLKLFQQETDYKGLLEIAVKERYRWPSDKPNEKGSRITKSELDGILERIGNGEKIKLIQFGKGGKETGKIVLDRNRCKQEKASHKILGKNSKKVIKHYNIDALSQEANNANKGLLEKLKQQGVQNVDEVFEYLMKEGREKSLMDYRNQQNKSTRPRVEKYKYKGMEVTALKEKVSMNLNPSTSNEAEAAWDLIEKSYECSLQAYEKQGGHVEGAKVIVGVKGSEYGFDLYFYADTENNRIFCAFKGSKKFLKQWIYDDGGGLFIKGKPLSANRHITRNIQAIQKEYPNSELILTGHSLGAALATRYSSELGLRAICHENPGIRANIDDSRVLSFQSQPNVITSLWAHKKGNVFQLCTPTSTSHILINKIDLPFAGLFSHGMAFIGRSIRRTKALLSGSSKNQTLLDVMREGSEFKYSNDLSDFLQARLQSPGKDQSRLRPQ